MGGEVGGGGRGGVELEGGVGVGGGRLGVVVVVMVVVVGRRTGVGAVVKVWGHDPRMGPGRGKVTMMRRGAIRAHVRRPAQGLGRPGERGRGDGGPVG